MEKKKRKKRGNETRRREEGKKRKQKDREVWRKRKKRISGDEGRLARIQEWNTENIKKGREVQEVGI